jgi:uncharacterized RDD family membrane protein YckC
LTSNLSDNEENADGEDQLDPPVGDSFFSQEGVSGGLVDLNLDVETTYTSIAPNQPSIVRDQPFASFFRRGFAYLLDNLIVGVFTFFFAAAASRSMTFEIDTLSQVYNPIYFLLIYYYVGFILYFTFTIGAMGQSVGKGIAGIRVVSAVDGTPIGYLTAFYRACGYIFSSALIWLGFLLAAVDPHHQSLHDKLAHTIVVEID